MGPANRSNKRNQVNPASWFPFTVPAHENQPNADQEAFVTEARDLVASLNPARARNTWAVIYGGLILVIPLDRQQGKQLADRRSLHTSLQLLMGVKSGVPVIVGAWQDSHYAWDSDPKQPDFQIAGHERPARQAALEWLASEMRRPIIRNDSRVLGIRVGSIWRHGDGKRALIEVRGLLPLVWLFGLRRNEGVGAGYFDPW